MRRPLFSTGVPQNPPQLADITATPDDALSVLDLRSLDTVLQSVTRLVTLYAINQTYISSDIISLALRVGDETPTLLAEITLPSGQGPGPVKVLDRYPLRGNEELLVSATIGDAPFVWGYYELDGEKPPAQPVRPLLPGALVSPFTYAPVLVVNADPGPETLHTLSEDYVDLVTLDLSTRVAPEDDVGALTVNDGSSTAVIALSGSESNVRIFDGIPFIAAASGGVLTLTAGGAATDAVAGWGSFTRQT